MERKRKRLPDAKIDEIILALIESRPMRVVTKRAQVAKRTAQRYTPDSETLAVLRRLVASGRLVVVPLSSQSPLVSSRQDGSIYDHDARS